VFAAEMDKSALAQYSKWAPKVNHGFFFYLVEIQWVIGNPPVPCMNTPPGISCEPHQPVRTSKQASGYDVLSIMQFSPRFG
jgi:hypothetical protein